MVKGGVGIQTAKRYRLTQDFPIIMRLTAFLPFDTVLVSFNAVLVSFDVALVPFDTALLSFDRFDAF